MSKIVVSAMNYDRGINKYEENTLPSETTPDMAYSIHELFARYKAGMPIPGSRTLTDEDYDAVQDDNIDVDPLNRIGISDLTELDELNETSRKILEQLNNKDEKPTD